ncbi:SLAC1 family transporter [Streptomyces sp. NPDC004270]
MSGISPLHAWWAQRPPAAGAAVMATGIVSVGLHLAGAETVSRVAPALACVAWAALAAEFAVRLLEDRRRWVAEAETPGALTAVAATTVLGTRFSALGRQTLAEALLALSAALWPPLLVLVVRRWRRRMPGAVFLGLVLYGFAVAHFEWRQVTEGPGDHWVAGGALAISALAGAKLLAADSARLYLWNDDDRGVLRTVTVAPLVLSLAWYVALLAAEAARPRPRYDVRRWATVFPMGMTAAAVPSVAAAVGVPWLKWPGRVPVWFAVAAWLAVAAGAVAVTRAPLRKVS